MVLIALTTMQNFAVCCSSAGWKTAFPSTVQLFSSNCQIKEEDDDEDNVDVDDEHDFDGDVDDFDVQPPETVQQRRV